jgi:hypothetical protein
MMSKVMAVMNGVRAWLIRDQLLPMSNVVGCDHSVRATTGCSGRHSGRAHRYALYCVPRAAGVWVVLTWHTSNFQATFRQPDDTQPRCHALSKLRAGSSLYMQPVVSPPAAEELMSEAVSRW